MSLTGEPAGPPVKTGLSLVDMATGYAAALALMSAALGARGATAPAATATSRCSRRRMNLNMYVTTWHLSRGWEPQRLANSAHPSIVPFQNFATRRRLDRGRAAPKDKFFDLLCGVLGLEWMTGDSRFASMAARRGASGGLRRRARRGATRDGSEAWLERLRAAGVPCGPVNDVAGAVSDPQTIARDLIAESEHPVLGTVRQIRSPLRVDGRLDGVAPGAQARRAHARGARRRSAATATRTSTGWPRPASSATSRSRAGAGSAARQGASADGRLTITTPATTTAMPTVGHAPGRWPRKASIRIATTGARNVHG